MGGYNVSKLQKRAASTLVLGPIAFLIILYGSWPFAIFVIFCASLALYEWVDLSLKTRHKILFAVLGFIYIFLSFLCCYWLRTAHSTQIALLFISMIWVSDIGAYFVGKTIGGPKMAVAISPNKTWSGLGGALISPSVLALLYFAFYPGLSFGSEEIALAVFSGCIVGVVGQAGDLVISFLKRQASVKDTGQLIPGHGGLLDRIDSMMLSAPVFLYIVSKFSNVFAS